MDARRVCLHLGIFACEEDTDGCMVLGHELLLLACRAGAVAREEEEAEDHATHPCCPSTFYLLAPPDTLECTLYRHVQGHYIFGTPRMWAVYNNLLVPRPSPCLCLALKAMAKWFSAWWIRCIQKIT